MTLRKITIRNFREKGLSPRRAPRRSLLPLSPKRTQVRLKSLLYFVWLTPDPLRTPDVLRGKSAVCGLNGHRLYYIISLFKVTYKSTTQESRHFHALLHLREFRYLRLMRASVSSTREPMKPESRPSSEQGLASGVNLSGAFDHEFTQTPLAKHASFSGSLVAEVSSLRISSVCMITLDFRQPNRETARCNESPKR